MDDPEIITSRPHRRHLSDLWLDGEEGKLHPAEERLLSGAARGEECWIGDVRPTFKNADNCVRAEFLRFIVLGGDEDHPLHESGVRLVGAYVYSESERLDFEGCTITENVWLRHCRIDCDLCLRDAAVESLGLTGCSVRSISGDRFRSHGSFHLRYGFVSSGLVSLKGANIGGSLNLKGARLENEPISLACDGIQTDVSLFLSEGFTAQGTVNLQNSEIGGDLTCCDGSMLSEDIALNVQRSTIEGAVFLNDGALFMGLVDLRSSRIDGSIF